MSFGKNLQYLRRLSAGMTQETLAEKLHVSRQTISRGKHGRLYGLQVMESQGKERRQRRL